MSNKNFLNFCAISKGDCYSCYYNNSCEYCNDINYNKSQVENNNKIKEE